MPCFPRAIWLAGFVSLSLAATPALAAFVESQVRAYSEDDHDPLLKTNKECDPLPPQDPEEPDDVDCTCDVFGGGFDADETCIDDDLFRFTNAPGARLLADSYACFVDACAFPGDPPDNGLGIAETDFGLSFVHVFSEDFSVSNDPRSFISDEGGAVSRWSDDLLLTTAVPDLSGATLRTTFRVRGSWQGRTCFVVHAQTYAVPSTPGSSDRAVFSNNEGFPGATLCLMPSGSTGPPPAFTDYGAENGTIDVALPLEIPITLPATVRLFSELRAFANGDDARVDGPNGGLEMTIERIEVPLGVDVASEAGALAAYNVPEPGVAATAAVALGSLLALRRR